MWLTPLVLWARVNMRQPSMADWKKDGRILVTDQHSDPIRVTDWWTDFVVTGLIPWWTKPYQLDSTRVSMLHVFSLVPPFLNEPPICLGFSINEFIYLSAFPFVEQHCGQQLLSHFNISFRKKLLNSLAYNSNTTKLKPIQLSIFPKNRKLFPWFNLQISTTPP